MSVKRETRPTRRGADKALGEWLHSRADGRWLYNGEHWLSVADVRVKVCSPEGVPHTVPGWLDLGPMSAEQLAAHLEVPAGVLPEKAARAPRAAATASASKAPSLESLAADCWALAERASDRFERSALEAAARAVAEAMSAAERARAAA